MHAMTALYSSDHHHGAVHEAVECFCQISMRYLTDDLCINLCKLALAGAAKQKGTTNAWYWSFSIIAIRW